MEYINKNNKTSCLKKIITIIGILLLNNYIIEFKSNDNNIGLVLYLSDNYGSMLVNYSVYRILKALGKNPIVIENKCFTFGLKKSPFIVNKINYLEKLDMSIDDNHLNKYFKTFLVGPDMSLEFPKIYNDKQFNECGLTFVNDYNRKIGLAISLGKSLIWENNMIMKLKQKIIRFNAISTREYQAANFINKILSKNDTFNMIDPIFIGGIDYLNYVSSNDTQFNDKNYILYYGYLIDKNMFNFISNIANYYNKRIIYLPPFYKQNINISNYFIKYLKLCDVPRLVNYFKNSDFVITDTFHGTVLSVIYNKKLIIIKDSNTTNSYNRFDRFETLFKLLEGNLNKAQFDNIDIYLKKFPKFDFQK